MSGVLEALGLSDVEERVYIALIDRPGASVREVSEALDVPVAKIQRALLLLTAKGLVSANGGRPRRFNTSSPEPAIEVLALKRQEEINQARVAASDLTGRRRAALEKAQSGELIEILTGSDIIRQRFLQFEQAAREEILAIDRPPYAINVGTPEVKREQPALARGVRCRVIYASAALEMPNRLSVVRELIALGEDARVLSDVPTKLFIVDRRIAMIPLDVRTQGVEDAVVVQASFLLHALIMLFESLWNRAMPLEPSPADGAAGNEQHELLRLLAAGLKDESIARTLGWSRSTVTRRMRELMDELGARTRFQAALLAQDRFGLTATAGRPAPH